MVAPAYADARSNLAKTMGLGRKAGPTPDVMDAEPDAVEDAAPEPVKAAEEPAPEPATPEPAKKARRGRAKATAG